MAAIKLFRAAISSTAAEEEIESELFVEAMQMPKLYYNLASSLAEIGENDEAEIFFRKTIALDGSIVEAKSNLAALLIKRGGGHYLEEAVLLCENVLEKDAFNSPAWFNLQTGLRQLSRTEEAVERSWEALFRLTQEVPIQRTMIVSKVSTPCCSNSDEEDLPVIVAVKWGSKYSAHYVNCLFAGVFRNLKQKHRSICFTDDSDGIDACIEIAPLPQRDDLQGWWYKAYLFSEEASAIIGLNRPILYIDLDTVVTGELTTLVNVKRDYFGVLSTDSMPSERRNGGMNSSVMTWICGTYGEIWTELEKNYESIQKIMYKFDGWIETILAKKSIIYLQMELHDSSILDFGQLRVEMQDSNEIPNACLVTFPLSPKPHEVIDRCDWVRCNWHSVD